MSLVLLSDVEIVVVNHDWPGATCGVTCEKNYHFVYRSIEFMVKRSSEMKIRDTEYHEINVELASYIIC